jgi:outer membrane receptor protein involved in Fe transport
MKKVIIAFALLLSGILTAQPSASHTTASSEKIGSVRGKVIDQKLKEPIPFANIIIKDKANNILTGGITDEKGEFSIKNIDEGNLIFQVQFIGYKTYSSEISITKGNRNVNVGTIQLEEEATSLEGVEVVAERSTIEQKVDRKVINVGKDLTTTGASASDIMNNIPSVNVDSQSGDISLRGNQNVRVLVDGKPTNVPASQLLKQIPSTSIKSIELITNPSAKYNPEGMSGIINIVLHKNTNIGFNGNVNFGLEWDINARYNSSIDMNYRNGKINVYGNYGNNIGKQNNWGFVDREDNNTLQQFAFNNNNKSHLFKVGLDFYLNDKNTLSFFTTQNMYDGKGNGTTDILFNNSSNFRQSMFNTNDNNTGSYNFAYKLDFNKEGHNIGLEVDYSEFSGNELANFMYSDATPNYIDDVNNERNNTTINLDYVNPLSDKSKLELGAEVRLRRTDNIYDTSNANLADSEYSYDRNIYSAYATFGQSFEKWSYQLGVRAEQYEANAHFEQEGQPDFDFNDEQFSLYPSGFLVFTPDEKNSYQLSYSRRVDRPGLGQINPIREWSTPLITSVGNPELLQQFTNSVEVNYTRRLKGGSITAGVFYRNIEDEINRAVYVDPEDPTGDRLLLTFDNFDGNSAYGVEVSSNYRPTKWWNFNFSFDLYSQNLNGIVASESVEVDNTAYNFRMNNNFKVTKNLTLSAFGFYRGANKGLQFNPEAMYFVNAGARYSFLSNKATFSINFKDIFNTQEFAFEGKRPYPQNGAFNWESQSVFVGLSYRFGGGKYRALDRKRRDNNEKQGSGGIF